MILKKEMKVKIKKKKDFDYLNCLCKEFYNSDIFNDSSVLYLIGYPQKG